MRAHPPSGRFYATINAKIKEHKQHKALRCKSWRNTNKNQQNECVSFKQSSGPQPAVSRSGTGKRLANKAVNVGQQ